MDYTNWYDSFIEAPRDKVKVYREAREFALEQGFTIEEAIQYAHEMKKREIEEGAK